MKKIYILILIGSLGANFFSFYVLDKALFFRKQVQQAEKSFINQGIHLKTVKDMSKAGIKPSGVFIGGSFVKFWTLPQDLPVVVSNQGGLEEKIITDYEKLQKDILGTGIDFLLINSGFCEIHTAVNAGKDVDAVINRNFNILKQIVEEVQADGIIPVITTLPPVRPAFVFPYTKFISLPSKKKVEENRALQKYNQMIRRYASDHHFHLVDFEKALADEQGILVKKFSVTDGEHLDIEGYRHLDQVLRPELEQIMKFKINQ